jgi:hypothetical protein
MPIEMPSQSSSTKTAGISSISRLKAMIGVKEISAQSIVLMMSGPMLIKKFALNRFV